MSCVIWWCEVTCETAEKCRCSCDVLCVVYLRWISTPLYNERERDRFRMIQNTFLKKRYCSQAVKCWVGLGQVPPVSHALLCCFLAALVVTWGQHWLIISTEYKLGLIWCVHCIKHHSRVPEWYSMGKYLKEFMKSGRTIA